MVQLNRKDTTGSRRLPIWFTHGVKEALKDKKAFFKKWKPCRNKESGKGAKLGLNKCKLTIRVTRKYYEECVPKTSKANSTRDFKCVKSRWQLYCWVMRE